MQADAVVLVLTTFITLMGGALGALFWSRLNRIEANMVTHAEFGAFRDEVRAELGAFRAEIRGESSGLRGEFGVLRDEFAQVRGELAAMRSDLTYVALAVGAHKPEASEG